MTHNENSRVKIPALVHLTRLGYQYGYARHFKFLKDTLFDNREITKLRDWLLPMLMNGQAAV